MTQTTLNERAQHAVERMMHEAHLRYQRQTLRGDHVDLPCDEVRGVRRVMSKSELKSREFRPEWFTHLRPNFWRGYFETLVVMAGDKK